MRQHLRLLRLETNRVQAGLMLIAYLATNRINNKNYVGITSRPLKRRWKDHCSAATRPNAKSHQLFQRAIKKYGPNNFSINAIASAKTTEDLLALEVILIAQEDSFKPNGYNLTRGGEATFGWQPTKANRDNIRNSLRAFYSNPAARQAASAKFKKAWNEPELRMKMIIAMASRPRPTEATKAKIAASLKGRVVSPETREKLRAQMTGKPRPESLKTRLSYLARGRRKGIPIPPDQLAKRSQTCAAKAVIRKAKEAVLKAELAKVRAEKTAQQKAATEERWLTNADSRRKKANAHYATNKDAINSKARARYAAEKDVINSKARTRYAVEKDERCRKRNARYKQRASKKDADHK